jgi:small GTP-binding protein
VFGLLNKQKLLSERQEALLDQERGALNALRDALQHFGADVAPNDMRTLNDIITHLSELFMLVIAGEFNSGKSSFINALLGEKIVPEGVTPTTDRILLLRFGDRTEQHLHEEYLMEMTFPAEVLRTLTVVDTPGTNAVIRRHEELTREFIPRSDLVLFVTSADRPFTESERVFLDMIQEWGKKIVIVLNKIDTLDEQETEQVVTFIRENARDLLGFTPEVFPVSARRAQQARSGQQNGQSDELWQQSRFEDVERYILETLDEEERIRLKLMSPLGVGQHLTDKYLKVIEGRMGTLQQDFLTIENIERQLAAFKEDLQSDFKYHLSDIDKILSDFELRGMNFFDDTLRLGNVWELRNSDRIRERFDQEVVSDVPQQIENRVQSLIDWIIEKNLRLWQSIMDYLQRNRVPEHSSGLIGDVGGSFEYNRAALIGSVAQTAQRVIQTYNREAESRALVEEVRNSLSATVLAGVGAVGLGALLVALLHTALLDFTGILAASLVAIGGLYLIPAKRRQVKREFHTKVTTMREQLPEMLETQFNNEADQMIARVREAISPYTRFIRTQREHLGGVQSELSDVDVDLGRIRAEIGK